MKKYIHAFFLALVAYISPRIARGAPVTLINPLKSDNVMDIISSIVDWLIAAGAPIAVVFIIWGAFQIMTAGGDTTKFETGKKTILYALMGYGIIFCAWGLVSVIQSIL